MKDHLLACVDYLHGYVVDGEHEAACSYEYARESKTLRMAARLRRKKPSTDTAEIYYRVERKYNCGVWFIQYPWITIWECPSFRAKSWNQLADAERRSIDWLFHADRIRPLEMMEARQHEVMGTFEKLKAQAQKAGWGVFNLPDFTTEPKMGKVAPIVDRGQWVDALFTLNFAKSPKRLLQEFAKWLDMPANKKRIEEYKGRSVGRTGTTGTYKDRLKDLAAWRLHRELGANGAFEFAQKHRKCDPSGNPLRFHDPRSGQSQKLPLNQAPLYSEESGFLKAKARAIAHLAELMPCEFEKQDEGEFEKAVMEASAKISKSSS